MQEARVGFKETLERRMLERLDDHKGNRGSDVLLMFALNAHDPGKYRPNATPVDDSAKEMLKGLKAGGARKLRMRETVREIEVETGD